MKEVGDVKRALAETHEEVRANEARAAAAKRRPAGRRTGQRSSSTTRGGIQQLLPDDYFALLAHCSLQSHAMS